MKTLFFGLVVMTSLMSCNQLEDCLLYVGTYTDGASEGIYCYCYHPEDGTMTLKHIMPNKENPSFLAIHPDGRYLYAVSEVAGDQRADSGSVIAYLILDDGRLERINQEATRANHPCHVAVSPDGKTVVASNYTSGSVSVYEVLENGALSAVRQVIRHEGRGPDTVRQQGPHAHAALFTNDGQLLVTADLGTDRIDFYARADEHYLPAPQEPVSMPPGFGPRHFDFSSDGQFIYVMNEMGSAVSVLQKKDQVFRLIETVSSLPAGYAGKSYGADIHLGRDGHFVYCSNRGHNSIAVFSRDEKTGGITLIQNQSVHGDWPRNFAIDPGGDYLLVANQKSNNITLFAIDRETGMLSYTNQSTPLPSPVCLKFLVK